MDQQQLLRQMVQQSRCLTCFDRTEPDARNTRDSEVFHIVRKHLWFTDEDLSESGTFCDGCWESIYAFHQFYVSAEQLYEQKKLPFGIEDNGLKKEMSEVFLVELTQEEPEIKDEIISDSEEHDALKQEKNDIQVNSVDFEDPAERDNSDKSDEDEDYEEDEEEEDVVDGYTNTEGGENPDRVIKQHKILDCENCEASDFTFKGLMTHLQKDHNVGNCFVTCCGNRYHTRIRLLEHVQYVLDPTSFKCDNCEEPTYFINRLALKRHLKVKHDVPVVTRPYNLTNRLAKMRTGEARTAEQMKKLEEAERRRSDKAAEDKMMTDHVQMGCIPCGTTFDSYGNLFRHCRVEHGQKPVVVCCGNRYHNRPRLLQHIQSVVNPVAFRCELCFRCFKSNYARNLHVSEMHPTDDSVKYRCDRCPKVFVREIKYRKHMQDHEECDKDQIKCEHCGKLYKSRHILYLHVRNKHHAPRFVCDICAKPFFLQSEFNKHKLQHENPDKLRMQCQHCLKWLKNREYWRAHIRLHVVGEVKCEICGRVTPNRVAYRSHLKNAHGARNHKCEWCGKSFNKALTLKEHVASKHTGATLYSCSFCPKTFNSNANMHSHQKKMHPVEWLAAKNSKAKKSKSGAAESQEPGSDDDESIDT